MNYSLEDHKQSSNELFDNKNSLLWVKDVCMILLDAVHVCNPHNYVYYLIWCLNAQNHETVLNSKPIRYKQNGILHMLDRNRRIKPHPERFQETEEEFDLVVTVEERVYDQVIECKCTCYILLYYLTKLSNS